MPHLPGQVVPSGTFTKPGMSLADKLLAQALQSMQVQGTERFDTTRDKQEGVSEPRENAEFKLDRQLDQVAEQLETDWLAPIPELWYG